MRSYVRLAFGAGIVLASFVAGASAQSDSPYIRVVEPDDKTIRLDVAVRTLAPLEEGQPLVQLVGAVHIADAPFYADVQSFLDIHEIVLYEGVGGGWEAVQEPNTGDEAAALLSSRRVMFLAMLGEVIAREQGDYPQTTNELVSSFHGVMRRVVTKASRDGWGREIQIESGEFDAVSLGADGRVGGDGPNADLRGRMLLNTPYVAVIDPGAAGLQQDLADALGLTFQLNAIDYSHPHWRNSDMEIGEIQEALGGAPASDNEMGGGGGRLEDDASDGLKAADALFRTLSGESFLAKASGFLLKIIGSSPTGRAMVKIMLADTLTQADKLLAMQPGGMAELMEVIIVERNNAVIQDLRSIIKDESDINNVAIFYGAGHFGDLEARIVDELGYTYESTIWIPAITIDLAEAGLTAKQVNFYRTMMKQMIDAQVEMMQEE